MFTVETGRVEEAIEIMREVSLWGQARGLRVWPLDWLTPEATHRRRASVWAI